MSLEDNFGYNWFNKEMVRRVDHDASTMFSSYIWVGATILKVTFPHLYSLCTQKEANTGDIWGSSDEWRGWRLRWHSQLVMWEMELINNLLELIGTLSGSLFTKQQCNESLSRLLESRWAS